MESYKLLNKELTKKIEELRVINTTQRNEILNLNNALLKEQAERNVYRKIIEDFINTSFSTLNDLLVKFYNVGVNKNTQVGLSQQQKAFLAITEDIASNTPNIVSLDELPNNKENQPSNGSVTIRRNISSELREENKVEYVNNNICHNIQTKRRIYKSLSPSAARDASISNCSDEESINEEENEILEKESETINWKEKPKLSIEGNSTNSLSELFTIVEEQISGNDQSQNNCSYSICSKKNDFQKFIISDNNIIPSTWVTSTPFRKCQVSLERMKLEKDEYAQTSYTINNSKHSETNGFLSSLANSTLRERPKRKAAPTNLKEPKLGSKLRKPVT